MIPFNKYITETKENKTLHLKHIEEEVLNGGLAGTKNAISFLKSLHDMIVDNNAYTRQEADEMESLFTQAESTFKSISAKTLNKIALNSTYRIEIKTWNKSRVREGKEIENTSKHVASLITNVEEKLNKSILEAKRSDTKIKRQQEKKIVMEFYKTNKNELKKIFDLQNLLIRAKTILSRKQQQIQE